MTHDELLATLTRLGLKTNNPESSVLYLALRAVVELHKPTNLGMVNHPEYWCSKCHKEINDYDCVNEEYPCPTIQAIEKELS